MYYSYNNILSSEGGCRDVTKKKRNKKMSTPRLKVILTPSLHFVSLEILDVILDVTLSTLLAQCSLGDHGHGSGEK